MRSVVLFLSLLAAAAVPRPAHALVVLGWHDVRDRIADGEPDTSAVSSRNLAMQLDWLRAHGYVPVTAQAVRDARAGRGALPEKAVLLTFDGGYRTTYTHVFPLLRAFGYPALVALPTARVGLPGGAPVTVDGRSLPGSAFLSWDEARAMQASGLVELASAGHDLATPVAGDPQGDLLPAVDARRWSGRYESDAEYRERLRQDLAASVEAIRRGTGRAPQAVVWPAGRGTSIARSTASALGMPLVLDDGVRSGTAELRHAGRLRLDDLPDAPVRLVMNENPGAGDLAYELRRDAAFDGLRVVRVALDDLVGADEATTSRNVDALVERMRSIRPSHVLLQAVSDTDNDGHADAAYLPTAGLPVRSDLFTHVAARLKARAGVETLAWLPTDVGTTLVDAIAATTPATGVVLAGDAAATTVERRPGFVTLRARTADAAASGDGDFALVMLPRTTAGAIDRMVSDVARTPGALERTVFLIDAGNAGGSLPAAALEAQARRAIAAGARHVGYAQDYALKDQPPLDPARAAISARAFPYLER